jgi:hypothetical protein
VTPDPPRTTRALLKFWAPLGLSWAMMSVAQPLVQATISRLPDVQNNLAAYGITYDLALLYESPIVMVLAATITLGRDRETYRLMRRFMLAMSAALTLLFSAIAFTPLARVVYGDLLGAPPQIASVGAAALGWVLPWTASIAWRRFHQAPTIIAGRTSLVWAGTIVRIGAMLAVLWAGVRWPHLSGAQLGALALSVSVVCEAFASTLWARRDIAALPAKRDGDGWTTGQIARFYAPLAATDFMRMISKPITAAGIARAAMPDVSLAAWPVAVGLNSLLSAGISALQESVVTVARDGRVDRTIVRFVLGLGLVFSALTAVFAFTAAVDWYLVDVVHTPERLREAARLALRILAGYPIVLAARNLFRGILIGARASRTVQNAMAAHLAALAAAMAAGAALALPGILVASVATIGAQGVEVAVLAAAVRRRRGAPVAEAGVST